MKSETNLKLGDIAKDRITGFEGVVVAVTHWLNGCIRVTIQPKALKDGKPIEAMTFDVEQVDLEKAGEHTPGSRSGGPMPEIKRI